ncbi:ATP synthase protein I2 [Carbonactinospora thermoautotrophica]|uniref:ATP synthase protein I2 n=1 Tax=Carbonactinospora thermoautotrophica TaxID=1469144 RepID=A0A132MNR8_9ACTN|nr:hypothetical protein [Carbonactinospora thermoautotrophica]KWW99514.1 ATP synthase protein I2 [Carbonactinospora thermoautotrophica]
MNAVPAVVAPMRRVLYVGSLAFLAAIPVAGGLGWLISGPAGLWGGLLGIAIPVVFFAITVVVALATARMPPSTLGVAVLGSWAVKIVVMLAVLVPLRGQGFYDRGVLFGVALAGTIGFLLLEAVIVNRSRVPYVEPNHK